MNTTEHQATIGVFDSGVGGLTVLRAIRAQRPNDKLLYVADTQHMPYGERHPDYITDRCLAVTKFFEQQDVTAMVVACNTASVVAINTLRDRVDFPVVGIEPAIKPAASVTRSGVVGVLATSRTLESPGVKRLCELYAKDVDILLTPCPGLVEQIEAGELNTVKTQDLLKGFLASMLEAGADTIVLGCTHYPFVRESIQEIAGNTVTVVEPGAAVARQLDRRLRELNLREQDASVDGKETFFSTGQVGDVGALISSLWGRAVSVRYLDEV